MASPVSLRTRLLLSMLICMLGLLAVGGTTIYQLTKRHLESEHDLLLMDRLEFYESTVILKGPQLYAAFDWVPGDFDRLSARENPDLVQLWFAKRGKEIPYRSPGMVNKPPFPRPSVAEGAVHFEDITLWDGRPARLASRIFLPRVEKAGEKAVPLQILIARDRVSVDKTIARVRLALGIIAVVLTVLTLLVAAWVVKRGIRPVHELEKQITAVPLDDAKERFSVPCAPSELQPVIIRLNALMDRVNAAIEHERQFASNAAHELRNPLAGIRSTVEAALSRSRTQEEYEEALDTILTSQQGMQRLVDHLLLLARLESGHTPTDFGQESVDIPASLKKAYAACFETAASRKLRVTWDVPSPAPSVQLSSALYNVTIRNLIDNAVSYTPEGGQVHIIARIEPNQCSVTVENTNPGLAPQDLEKTFTPFWRRDPNASGHRGNAGIGLALCRRIADTLGGSMSGEITPDRVRYTIQLPCQVAA